MYLFSFLSSVLSVPSLHGFFILSPSSHILFQAVVLKDQKGVGLVWQVGDPAVVFLDEPSSGMDPLTRRAMWNLITNAVIKKNMSVMLTTHNMEECEALCNRIGIMVAGSLVCLGSIQQIKSCFGSGTHTLFFLLFLPLFSLLEMATLKKQLILQ